MRISRFDERLDVDKINFITDKFLEVSDDLGLVEVGDDETTLSNDGFFYIPDESKNFWSVHHNKMLNQLVITMVFDRSKPFNNRYLFLDQSDIRYQDNLETSSYKEALCRLKIYMEYIKRLGYSSYLECPIRFQVVRHNMLLTIRDVKFIKTIHPRWGGQNDIRLVI